MVKMSGESSTSRARKVAAMFDKTKQKTTSADTLKLITRHANRKPGSVVNYFDNTSPPYGWLPHAWVAEERRMPSGRLYRYYYDDHGFYYRTKYEVVYTLEKMGLIVLDAY